MKKTMYPNYEHMHEWDNYANQLQIEYIQSVEEGRSLEDKKMLFEAVMALPADHNKAALADILFQMVQETPVKSDYPYEEPSEYEEIEKLCAHGYERRIDKEQVSKEKIRGAWYGRICGCLLGKPVEGFLTTEIIPLLKDTNNYPMHSYIEQGAISQKTRDKFSFDVYHRCYADTLNCAPADDDTNYTVLASELIEKYGRDFTPENVAKLWLDSQPKASYCTAERAAFRNFVNGFEPPVSAVYKNPYREWIGAQIRGDYFGYINPGNPREAAKMAFKDASISHIKNGIYGEMFVAAALAWASVCDDVTEVIRAGLSEIPSTSRLYCSITEVLEWKTKGDSFEQVIARIYDRYDETDMHHWCHTISNAMIVTACLLYGNGNYGDSICKAVQTGFDTDCNGATVGSVTGMMKGYSAIDKKWLKPIHGMLETDIFGIGNIPVEDLVEKTYAHI